ncbi:hypothetical protein BKA64DRAFT_653258 [Cadophora sp. MPI-SDFR-AT-0126]|nr:hypothetical protein BKA64DRAFT_653258 [Leotiomycetes sp. MPI-SDFR-AT-0126]
MSARKPHRKSRNGCLSCKSRHIKCGEEHPVCQNCIEYELECQFPDPTTLKKGAHPSCNVCNSRKSPAVSRAASRSRSEGSAEPENDINTSDLELLHHFSTSTYLTMSNVPAEQQIWQTTLIKLGLRHKFLLRGILGLSALHLGHLAQLESPADSMEYMVKASMHQNIGLSDFRKVLENIDATTFDAVLAFSCVIPIHSIAVAAGSAYKQAHSDSDILSSFLSSLSLFRSVNHLLLPSLDVYTSSTISPLLQITTQKLPEPSSFPGMDSLERLELACTNFPTSTTSFQDQMQRNIFSSAIVLLRSTFATTVDTTSTDRFTIGAVMIWTISVSDEYFIQLSRGHPSALAILAHYAVLLHRHNDVWWLQGLGASLVEKICMELGDEWSDIVSWPRMAVGL